MGVKLIVALDDLPTDAAAIELARRITSDSVPVWGFKVHDSNLIRPVKDLANVMMDRKALDIPSVVAKFVRDYEAFGADLVTISLAGGPAMIKAASEAAKTIKVIGVGPLTSFTDGESYAVYNKPRQHVYIHQISLGVDNGVHGLVGAASDMGEMDNVISCHLSDIAEGDTPGDPNQKFLQIITGVRPPDAKVKNDDQATCPSWPAHLLKEADLVVVGRPITQAADPIGAARIIAAKLAML